MEPAEEVPTSYKDMVEGRVENRLINPKMPPLEEVPLGELSGEPTTIFTCRGNTLRRRVSLFGANVAHISPRGRGLTKMIKNNLRSPFLGQGRPSDNE